MSFARRTMLTLSSLLCVALQVSAAPGSVHQDVPASIDPSARYLIYLHGRIIEVEGPQAVSPQFGRYEYDAILKALAGKGLVVISEVRGPETGPAYAKKVAAQVRKLAAGGVPPDHITVAGFSKGGTLALLSSVELAEPRVNFVIMAGCGPRVAASVKGGALKGRMLSLYDQADTMAGSCRPLFEAAPNLATKEVRLTIGRGHGVFYTPRKEWIDPVADWARRP